MPDFLSVIDLADKLGVLHAIKDKLVRQIDPAADKLVAVLAEISKIYTAIETEMVSYLGLFFDPTQGLAAERKSLLMLEGNAISIRIEESRGHCHKIENIFKKFLSPWFQKVLDSADFARTEELFRRLSEADFMMIDDLQKVGAWLAQQAAATLSLVDEKKYDQANVTIVAARREILPTRQAISKALAELRRLESDFIQASQIV